MAETKSDLDQRLVAPTTHIEKPFGFLSAGQINDRLFLCGRGISKINYTWGI